MKRLYAVVLGVLALFAFSALAAPDVGKVKFGAYEPFVAAPYSVPSAAPPTAAETQSLTYKVIHSNIGASGAGPWPSTPVAPILTAYMSDTTGDPPAYHPRK